MINILLHGQKTIGEPITHIYPSFRKSQVQDTCRDLKACLQVKQTTRKIMYTNFPVLAQGEHLLHIGPAVVRTPSAADIPVIKHIFSQVMLQVLQ